MTGLFFLWLIVALVLCTVVVLIVCADIADDQPVGETVLLGLVFWFFAAAWPITLPIGAGLYAYAKVRGA